MKKIQMEVNVKLTDEEKLIRGKALADVEVQKNKVETDKKEAMAEFGEQIKILEGEIKKWSKILANGEEPRMVEVAVVKDFENHCIKFMYGDETVSIRAMMAEDEQEELSLE